MKKKSSWIIVFIAGVLVGAGSVLLITSPKHRHVENDLSLEDERFVLVPTVAVDIESHLLGRGFEKESFPIRNRHRVIHSGGEAVFSLKLHVANPKEAKELASEIHKLIRAILDERNVVWKNADINPIYWDGVQHEVVIQSSINYEGKAGSVQGVSSMRGRYKEGFLMLDFYINEILLD